MPGPGFPSNSGSDFYGPGGVEAAYERIQNQAELPGVAPPSGQSEADVQQAAAILRSGFFDEDAPDILQLIQGGVFNPPFTVTLMQREGMREFRADAGVKREANYKLCKETVRDPSDLLRLKAGIVGEIYKPLNNMTLEFQLMLYISAKNGALYNPNAARPSTKGKISAGMDTDED
ncbi:MAG: hypothetical protein AB7L09_01265 [Nitrospira sp.]